MKNFILMLIVVVTLSFSATAQSEHMVMKYNKSSTSEWNDGTQKYDVNAVFESASSKVEINYNPDNMGAATTVIYYKDFKIELIGMVINGELTNSEIIVYDSTFKKSGVETTLLLSADQFSFMMEDFLVTFHDIQDYNSY